MEVSSMRKASESAILKEDESGSSHRLWEGVVIHSPASQELKSGPHLFCCSLVLGKGEPVYRLERDLVEDVQSGQQGHSIVNNGPCASYSLESGLCRYDILSFAHFPRSLPDFYGTGSILFSHTPLFHGQLSDRP
jgi:hypothetical protein